MSVKNSTIGQTATFIGSVGIAIKVIDVSANIVPDTVAGWLSGIGLVLFVAGLIQTLRALPEELTDKVEKTVAEAGDLAYAELLRQFTQTPEVLLRAIRRSDDIVARTAGEVIHDFIAKDVGPYVRELEQYMTNSDPIELRHESSVYGTLRSVLKALPSDSVWLGITHLTEASAWDMNVGGFQKFNASVLEAARQNRLVVYRLYVTASEPSEAMLTRMRGVADSGVHVRVLRTKNKVNVPDVTLLYEPPAGVERIDGQDGYIAHPVRAIEQADYRPICLLEFDAQDSEVLSRVVVRPASAESEFGDSEQMFRSAWRRAEPIDAYDVVG